MQYGLRVSGRRADALLLAIGLILVCTGCTRRLYRRQADREAHYLIREKSVGTPWQVPESYTIEPDPRSRFFDPTNPAFPTLPPAGPGLYQYQLPQLSSSPPWQPEPLPPALPKPTPAKPDGTPELPLPPAPPAAVTPPPSATSVWGQPGGVQLASFQRPVESSGAESRSQQVEDPFADDFGRVAKTGRVEDMELQAIDARFWNQLPAQCLVRMLEFTSVRVEYADTFQRQPTADMVDSAPRFDLRELFELALINSRAYQRQKELLYEAALNVSLERYAYATKFLTRGNSVDTTYTHSRVAGTTVNTLSVPSSLNGDRLLATGGTIVGQFANDVLLTFNGPTGFAADIGSDMLFQVTQSVFQRDIILNGLIQSERNLVYAARRFARFRKEFFLDIADTYYGILLTNRSIEIQSLNYFSQVRNFQQARAEISSGISSAPNVVFLNQYEQSVLRGRSSLLRICNALEQSLDRFKITLGLPTETPINIDLDELDRLTRRDLVEVYREQARRWQHRVSGLRATPSPEVQGDILTADKELTERLIKWLDERSKINTEAIGAKELNHERARFRLDAARLVAIETRAELTAVQKATPPRQPILVYQRQADAIASFLNLINRQGKFAYSQGVRPSDLDQERATYLRSELDSTKIQEDLAKALDENPDERVIIGLIDRSTILLAELETLSQNLDDRIFGHQVESVELAETIERTDRLVNFAAHAFEVAGQGLPPIDISFDAAMVTALVQRLDLMNERGALADDWRGIKIAADELRSFMNLSASQQLRTEKNRPFGFSTRNAQTRLRLSWDLPLNRKSQRNAYRRSLINYHVGLRGLMRFEDDIKLEVRNQLRQLELARATYPIVVTQAALAEEQVLSVRLQLILGLPGVRAPDLIEAYDDSRAALFDTASERINYITERARFALSLEVMMLDDTGFWPEINDPKYQPEPNPIYPWNAGSAYGDYPSFLKVSHEFRRMLNYPPPGADAAMLEAQEAPEAGAAPPGQE